MGVSLHDVNIDLYLVGVGIGGWSRMTYEAGEVLSGASRVAHLTPFTMEQWRTLAPSAQIESLESAYLTATRRQAYEQMADRSFAAAKSAREDNGYACFVVYGHPSWFVSTTRILLNRGSSRGVRTSVVPGISSLDTLLVDAPVDLGSGICVLDVFKYLEIESCPNPLFPLVLMYFDEIYTQTNTLSRLKYKLLKSYPDSQRLHIVRSGVSCEVGKICESIVLRNLESISLSGPGGYTLVVEAKEFDSSDPLTASSGQHLAEHSK